MDHTLWRWRRHCVVDKVMWREERLLLGLISKCQYVAMWKSLAWFWQGWEKLPPDRILLQVRGKFSTTLAILFCPLLPIQSLLIHHICYQLNAQRYKSSPSSDDSYFAITKHWQYPPLFILGFLFSISLECVSFYHARSKSDNHRQGVWKEFRASGGISISNTRQAKQVQVRREKTPWLKHHLSLINQ